MVKNPKICARDMEDVKLETIMNTLLLQVQIGQQIELVRPKCRALCEPMRTLQCRLGGLPHICPW
ncbi:unnamed protein product [Camellia sinensis]